MSGEGKGDSNLGKDILPDFKTMSISYKNEKKALLEPVRIETNGTVFSCHTIVGHGSFGVVFQALIDGTDETVAIKKVLQDRRFKNRELEIMETLHHPNVVKLKYSFFTTDKNDDVYLNLVMEYIPETVYVVSRHYSKAKQAIPAIYCKTYMYQLFRALAYIHNTGVCHRDIKPQNLLLDPVSARVKLCDFGSAKVLLPGKPNVSYICSRYYRAPELIFGSRDYTCAIDLWSMGCVMAELYIGQPLFPGESGVDQLVEVIKVLGTPTAVEIKAMNESYTELKFPVIKANPWTKVFNAFTPEDAVDLISKLLVYTPTSRFGPFDAMSHHYFDDIRAPGCVLPGDKPLPDLFNFSRAEVKHMGRKYAPRLIPAHARLPFSVDDVLDGRDPNADAEVYQGYNDQESGQ